MLVSFSVSAALLMHNCSNEGFYSWLLPWLLKIFLIPINKTKPKVWLKKLVAKQRNSVTYYFLTPKPTVHYCEGILLRNTKATCFPLNLLNIRHAISTKV